MTLRNNKEPLLYYMYIKHCASFQGCQGIQTGVTVCKAQFGSQSAVFCLVWPWNLIDALKNNRAPLLCYCKLCASFHSHLWNQTEVSPQTPNLGKNRRIFQPSYLEIWQMTRKKTIAHLLYATLSIVLNFIAICEFKLKLQSRNSQFGSNSTIILSRVTLRLDR